jgi:hypothetical protein
MKRGAATVETPAAAKPRTAAAPARQPQRSAKSSAALDVAESSADQPAQAKKKTKRAGSVEGALEHTNAANFAVAGASSLSVTFAGSYAAGNWGNPGAIQKAKVSMFLFCLVMFLMHLFSLVRQVHEDVEDMAAQFQKLTKEFAAYKETKRLTCKEMEKELAPPSDQVAPPSDQVSAAPKMVVRSAPFEEVESSTSSHGSSAKAKAVVEKCFSITGKKMEAQAKSKMAISNVFRDCSFALDGAAVAQEMLKLAGGFSDDITGEIGIYLSGKQRKAEQDAHESVPID